MGIDCSLTEIKERNAAVLRVTGDLDFDERDRFQTAVDGLLATEARNLIIDLSRISRMSSVYIGTLVSEGGQARTQGRSLSVSIPGPIAKICRESGLDKVTNLIVASD